MRTINWRTCPDDLHRALKVEAAKRGVSMQALLAEAARELLKQRKKESRKRSSDGPSSSIVREGERGEVTT